MYTRKRVLGFLSVALSVGLFCVALVPQARAGQWTQRTVVHFSAPVEIPGRVLPAGTYTFKLMNSPADRNIVEIYNKKQTRLYAIVMTEATYRLHRTSKPVITMEERPVGSPEAIHKWFYPGDRFGHDFIYPHSQGTELAVRLVRTTSANG